MSDCTWQATNGASTPSEIYKPFTITAYPKTDIWRRGNGSGDVFDAPYIYTTKTPQTFHSVAVTVTVPWKTQFDQGGLLLAFPTTNGAPWRWIKAGIEMFEGKPALGVVGTDRYSDWSLAPMPAEGDGRTARFSAVRDGSTLWVYVIHADGTAQALREVKWAFLDLAEDVEVRVGVYAAKPTPDEGDEKAGVEVGFEELLLA